MTSIGKPIFTVAVLFWALDPALGQDPVAPVGTTVVDIQSPERWIRQLGHETMAKRFATKGYIGFNAKTLTQLLMPGQSVDYRMKVAFLEKTFKLPGAGLLDRGFSFNDAPKSVADVLAVGNSLSSFVSLDGAESVRLTVEHSVKGQYAGNAEGKGDRVDAVWWNGSLKSNSVTLQIDRSINKDAGVEGKHE